MFLNFWIISTIVCLLLFMSEVVMVAHEVDKQFTKEERHILKQKESGSDSKYAWFVYVFVMICPIVNIFIVLCAGFHYRECIDDMARKYRKRLGKETSEDIAREYFDACLKKLSKEYLNAKYGVPKTQIPEIVDVIFNEPATIVFWADGTKTVVKAQDEDFDPEKGLAMAISKKALGNQGNFNNEFKKWIEPYERKQILEFLNMDKSKPEE